MEPIIIPPPLKPGDKVAVISPASAVNPEFVNGAVRTLTEYGLTPVTSPHATGRQGSYSATAEERTADIADALLDKSVKAILCSRGGYGAVHLLDSLSRLPLRDNPKWLIGFSDISALHALMSANGIASIHASMARQMALGTDDPHNTSLLGILTGKTGGYGVTAPPHRLNRPGRATGRIAGGNLAVLAGLISTPYDMLRPGTILFIEDIAEPIYKVERILYQLTMSGVLPSLNGLIVGQFTEYSPDRNFNSMEEMIHRMVAPYGYPVAFNAPIGHVDDNMPLIESATATLTIGSDGMSLNYGGCR